MALFETGKLVVVAVAAVLLVGSGLAVEGFDGDTKSPHITEQPVQDPGNVTPNATLPSLPGQASDTAKKVLTTIDQAFDTGVQNLGNLLNQLLGGGEPQ